MEQNRTIKDILEHLPGFKSVPKRSYDYGATITDGTIDIFIRLHGGRGGKGSAFVDWPRDENGSAMSAKSWGVVPYDQSGPECRFTPTKTPKAIARDIERKVIEPGRPLMVQVHAKLGAYTKAKRDRESGTAALAALLGEEVFGQEKTRITKMYRDSESRNPYLEVKAGHETYTLKVSSLSLKETEKLIKLAEKLLGGK